MPRKSSIRLALIAELPATLALCAALAAGCAANEPLPPLETRPVVPSPLILQQLTQPKCWLKPLVASYGTLEYGVVAENKTHEYLDAEAHFAAYAPDGTRVDSEPSISSHEVFDLAPHEKAYFTASGSSYVPLTTDISAIRVVCRFTFDVISMPPRLRRSVQIYDVSLVQAGDGISERRFVGTARIATRWPQEEIPRVIFRYYDQDGILLAASEHTNVWVQREVPLRVMDSQFFDAALPLPQKLTVSAYAQ